MGDAATYFAGVISGALLAAALGLLYRWVMEWAIRESLRDDS